MESPICPKCKRLRMVKASPNRPGGRIRWQCRPKVDGRKTFCYSTTDPSKPPRLAGGSVVTETVFKRQLSGKIRSLVITSAQNATPVHERFFSALQIYAKENNSELLVIPLRYKNPTSIFTKGQDSQEWWASTVVPYLWNVRKRINSNLTLLADIKTEAAASEPLRGFDSISGSESAILGHTKLQMRVIPVHKTKLPKILTTTGTCTVKNYTDTKRGKIGEFHHALAAVVVEFEDKVFHLRHVNANAETGEFTDLDKIYSDQGVRKAERPLALVMGDTHVDFMDPKVKKATFGQRGIIDTLDPRALVFHDLLDNYAINPHHVGNPFNAIAKLRSNRNSVQAEVQRAVDFVLRYGLVARPAIVVSSNHDDFLRRWIMRADWKMDPENAEFYLQTALAMVRGTKLSENGTVTPNPFAMLLEDYTPAVRALGPNESFVLGGVELGMHGEIGPNGAKGSIKNLRRIGTRSIIGHSHTPGIEEGCYQVGTSTYLKLEYNLGPSSWLNTHCILHADGKRQLINIIDGTWRM
jgi:hypothetical protein